MGNACQSWYDTGKKRPGQILDCNDDFKFARGYWRVYDKVLDHLGSDCEICELGIGNGGSHSRWYFATTGRVIGLELDSKNPDTQMVSQFVPDHDNGANPNAQRNYSNVRALLDNEKIDESRFDFRYESDAFDPANAEKVFKDYPNLGIVINDSKHRPWAFDLFKKAWEPYMNDNTILIQEDFARHPGNPNEWSCPNHVKLGLDTGWTIYDFRKVTTFKTQELTDEYENASLLGVYYKNPKWKEVLSGLDEFVISPDMPAAIKNQKLQSFQGYLKHLYEE